MTTRAELISRLDDELGAFVDITPAYLAETLIKLALVALPTDTWARAIGAGVSAAFEETKTCEPQNL